MRYRNSERTKWNKQENTENRLIKSFKKQNKEPGWNETGLEHVAALQTVHRMGAWVKAFATKPDGYTVHSSQMKNPSVWKSPTPFPNEAKRGSSLSRTPVP